MLSPRDEAQLYVAEYEQQVLAIIFVTAFAREAIYIYGASGNAHRNVMPNHALHWAAIQWAKARGCAWYDFWGIPENNGAQPGASLPDSLYQFKRGFGGEEVHYTGAWDAVYASVPHSLYRLARRARRSSIG